MGLILSKALFMKADRNTKPGNGNQPQLDSYLKALYHRFNCLLLSKQCRQLAIQPVNTLCIAFRFRL